MGDFNMTPQELVQHYPGFLDHTKGCIRAPDVATCKSTTGGRTIDFIIVDQRIGDALVKVWLDLGFPSSPTERCA